MTTCPGRSTGSPATSPLRAPPPTPPTIGRRLRHDVATVGPQEPIARARARMASSGYRVALVITADDVLLGRLRADIFDGDPDSAAAAVDLDRPVAEVMEPGPSTLRPHETTATVRARLQDRGLTYALVTDPDGRLLGTVHRGDL
ncbi:MAG: hypothetical protein DLM61_18870 [Pseudonocardiales bacterium]|nr:MAG: hypothetical protein DLM61_18870 [Pseudonocardiales bacterium]